MVLPPIHSKLIEDPELAILVSQFVETIPRRVQIICNCIEKQDLEMLRLLIHQMKGSFGSYGFDEMTPILSRLDCELNSGVPLSSLGPTLSEFLESCLRMTSSPLSVPKP